MLISATQVQVVVILAVHKTYRNGLCPLPALTMRDVEAFSYRPYEQVSDTCFSPERPLISRIPVSCVVKLHPTARHYTISDQGGSGTMQSLVLDQWVVSTLMQ